jgi:hypothetical protein
MEVSVIRSMLLILLSYSTALARVSAADPVAIARRFMPPNTELATDYTYDYTADRVGARWPAVLTGHILAPGSQDIVFAYYSPQIHVLEKTLFLDVLHRVGENYEKVYEVSYRSQLLLSPTAMRLIHLPGAPADAVAVLVGIGASLGGHLDIYLWRGLAGWQNVFPPNGSMEYFYFFSRRQGLEVALTSASHPGLDVSPPPTWFRWDGIRFVNIAPPEGSSKWALPE